MFKACIIAYQQQLHHIDHMMYGCYGSIVVGGYDDGKVVYVMSGMSGGEINTDMRIPMFCQTGFCESMLNEINKNTANFLLCKTNFSN